MCITLEYWWLFW